MSNTQTDRNAEQGSSVALGPGPDWPSEPLAIRPVEEGPTPSRFFTAGWS